MSDSVPIPDITDEPIDAEFRPAETEDARGAGGPGWISAIVLSGLAALAGAMGGFFASQLAPGNTPAPVESPQPLIPIDMVTGNDLGLEADARADEDEKLQAEINRLESRIEIAEEAMLTRPGPAAPGADLPQGLQDTIDGLAARLTAIEQAGSSEDGAAPEALSRSLAAAQGHIESLQTRAETLEQALALQADEQGETAAGLRRDIVRLEEDIATVRAGITTLQGQMDARATTHDDSQTRLAEAALALSQIDAAARRGQGFLPALASLQRVRPENSTLAALEPFAADGAPTLAALTLSFETVATEITAAMQADTPDSGATSLARRLFGDAIEVRREGDASTVNAVEDARAALAEGDLGGAILAIETLDGSAAVAGATWLQNARDRRTLERTLDRLRLDLMAEDR